MLRKFAIAAINTESGEPGIMSFADTPQEAEGRLAEATRAAGWVQATICDSLEQLHEFAKAARSAKLNL
ncbi:MAG: hypothetical protein ABSA78_09585 [Candidatus Sulfotelmatobacter sp.]|jgi:predicted RNase H-like HicB family nuclease